MIGFSAAETTACCQLVELALREDLGKEFPLGGDITSRLVIPPGYEGRADFVSRCDGVVAGVPAVALVWGAVDQLIQVQLHLDEGALLRSGSRIATVTGSIHSILCGERIALNFLQHLSGIATLTRRYVDAISGTGCELLDTRKTLPGWRLLEKYAVRCGGGQNHRMGLYDGILIKDNHLAAMSKAPTLRQVLAKTRRESAAFGRLPLEIEVDTLEQFQEAIAERPDIVLLDNMGPDQLRDAVRLRDANAPDVLLEASGGITLENIRSIAEAGVDRISVGALTHSAPALDIGLDYAK